MTAGAFPIDGTEALVSRGGYTGEDGFEISLPAADAPALWRRLAAEPEVEPAGLGARDSLRLEAGHCLYGHDIDATTSPVEAGLAWSIGKQRRREGGFPGAARVQRELAEGPRRRRVGIRPDGRAPAREGTAVLNAEGAEIGTVTSGGFGPTVRRAGRHGLCRGRGRRDRRGGVAARAGKTPAGNHRQAAVRPPQLSPDMRIP